ncbi:MAG TPA: BON domain-containing protein [Hellea balneolensis]|uniref:BON domain-containing protein n=1 Tax=Hellea balneolensis TaxID=287478 RepID=A0A7C5LTB3_9PROT|nr:BON domain-containing protein [Hellea balneolensis]
MGKVMALVCVIMKRLTMILSASAMAFCAVQIGGCAVATAGVKKGDERNFARSLNDINAGRAIKARMGRVEGFKLGGVDVEVAEGIVVLSGNVPRAEDRVEAERIAWSAPKIVQVGNEIKIAGKQGLVRNTKDGVLHQSVRARMIANKNIKARNYNIEVHDGVVYLLGVARSPEELALAAQTASTTKGTREVISYVKVAGDNSARMAQGPGYNGVPSTVAQNPTYAPYVPQAPSGAGEYPPIGSPTPLPPIGGSPLSNTPGAPSVLDDDAIESGEPYYLDPETGERVEIPEGVTPIPYVPDQGPGSLGAGGKPLPPGAKPSQILGANSVTQLPSDQYLGLYRSGAPGTAVSVIESAPYTLDPVTGAMIPVKN